jgi:hypothetical protein
MLSCKKEKLEGDKEIFIGSWNWEYSNHEYGWCDNQQFTEIITPSTENKTFTIEFVKKGCVYFYEDNKLKQSYRVVFSQFQGNLLCSGMNDSNKFGVQLDNNDENVLFGCINKDTMRLGNFSDFIFSDEPGCEDYDHYFIKQ